MKYDLHCVYASLSEALVPEIPLPLYSDISTSNLSRTHWYFYKYGITVMKPRDTSLAVYPSSTTCATTLA